MVVVTEAAEAEDVVVDALGAGADESKVGTFREIGLASAGGGGDSPAMLYDLFLDGVSGASVEWNEGSC